MRRAQALLVVALASCAAGLGLWWVVHADGAPNEAPAPREPAPTSTATGPRLEAAARAVRAPVAGGDAGGMGPGGAGGEGGAEDASVPLAAPASLSVQVVGWEQRPVAGAEVRLVLPEQASDADRERAVGVCDGEGRVSLTDLRWKRVAIAVAAVAHFGGADYPEPLEAGELRQVRIHLQPKASVRGRVVRAADGAPLAGAIVRLRDRPPDGLHAEESWGECYWDGGPVVADGEGRFLLDGLRIRQDHGIWGEVRGYECGERLLYLSHPGSEPELVLALRAAGTCVARVLDHRGEPVADWRVVLVPEDVMLRREAEAQEAARAQSSVSGELAIRVTDPLEDDLWCIDFDARDGSWFGPHTHPIYSAVTDAQGVARVRGLALGRVFRVVPFQDNRLGDTLLRATWGSTVLRVEATTALPDVALELRVGPVASLSVCVLDEGGAAPSATPWLRWGAHVRSANEGEHEVLVSGLMPGVTALQVEAAGYAPQSLEVDLRPGEMRRLDVRLRRGAVLRGVVVDASGLPFTRGSVEHVGGTGEPAALDERGAFELIGLQPGLVTLTVVAQDADEPATHQVLAPADDLRLTLPRGQRGSVVARIAPIARADDEPAKAPRLSLFKDADDALGWRGEVVATGVAGPDGAWRWSVRPGSYVVCASHDECVVVRRTVEVVAGREIDLGLLVPELGPAVEGDVLHADGTPAAYARLRFRGHAITQADGSGRFRLAHRPAGSVQVLVGGGDLVARESVETPPPGGRRWLLRASRGGVLEGRVPAGSSPDALDLRIEPIEDGARPPREVPRIDTAGRFRLALAPGRYRVALLRGADLLDDADVRVEEGRTGSLSLAVGR